MNETHEIQKMKEHYKFFAIGSAIYAIFYTLCMYKNGAGITYPFFVAGSILFFCLCMKKLDISVKKDSILYIGSMMLLGVSTFLTADGRIIFFNKTGVFLLTISFLLHQVYEDKNWSFARYLGSVICTVFCSIAEIPKPFQHFASQEKNVEGGKKSKGIYVLIGLCISIPLFLIVSILLISADRVFFNMAIKVLTSLNVLNVIGIGFSIVFMFFASYCVVAYLAGRHLKDEVTEKKQTEAVLAIIVTLPITILYVVFSVVQVVYLFMGKVDLKEMTYAQYARTGFFQLLLLCILNLVIVLVGSSYFKENILLKTILTLMSICTYIMIVSSGMRMILYIKHYYLTFLRILVLWALVVIFILLTGVLISIFVPRFPLFRYGMVVVTICYLLLSFSKPDYLIASCNLSNADTKGVHDFFDTDAYNDYRYLSNLCEDAAPVIIPYLEKEGYNMTRFEDGRERAFYQGNRGSKEEWGYAYMRDIIKNVDNMGIRKFNVSKYQALKLINGK